MYKMLLKVNFLLDVFYHTHKKNVKQIKSNKYMYLRDPTYPLKTPDSS